MAAEKQRRAEREGLDRHGLLRVRETGQIELEDRHLLLPVGVARKLQTEALVDIAHIAGAVVREHHAAPAIGVAEHGEGDLGNILLRHRQIPGGDLGALGDEAELFGVAAVVVAHGEINDVVVVGRAVIHERVAVLELHALQRRALREQAAGDLRRNEGERGGIGAPYDECVLRRKVPRAEPFVPVCADGHVLRRHPAGAADGVDEIERAVGALGVDHERLIDAHAGQMLIVKLRVGRIVENLLVRGEGVQRRARDRDGIAHRLRLARAGVGHVLDHRAVERLVRGAAVGLIGPAEIIFGVGLSAAQQRLALAHAVDRLGRVFEIIHVRPALGDVCGILRRDLLRRHEQGGWALLQRRPVGRAGHVARDVRHIGRGGGAERAHKAQAEQQRNHAPQTETVFHFESSNVLKFRFILSHSVRAGKMKA